MQHVLLVVIGAGPAGCSAAVQCARLGVPPRLFDQAGEAGGLCVNARCIDNYPGLETALDGPTFARRLQRHCADHGLAVERARIERIVQRSDRFELTGPGLALSADAVIAAVGTVPNEIDIPGAHALAGELVFYELRPLLRRLPQPSTVVAVGGGEAACDSALALADRGTRVRLLLRGATLRARGQLAAAVGRTPSIELLTAARCLRLARGGDGRVRVDIEHRGSLLNCDADAVLGAIGRRSAAPMLLSTPEADTARGLFVIGDARRGALGQLGMAVGDGLAAAAAAVEWLQERARCG